MLALIAAIQPSSPDPRIGSWTLTSAQSSLTPPDKLSVTDVNGTVHVVISGETHLDFTAKPDARDTPVTGNPGFNQIQLRRIDSRQSEVKEKKDGAVVSTVRAVLTKDAGELTVTTTSAGRPSQIAVWKRSGGTRVARDPLAGEWTEDLSKTRLRQGITLKIEPDGGGEVRFSGEDSYNARFDGKPYDVRNSRNDTVTLELTDPHTVNATYRRDNQVSQKDTWTVSPDGHQMTLTRTASFETGQHLAEKLTFKKQ